jgi:hypothetical protein
MYPENELIVGRFKERGEWVYARGLPDHPPFKSASLAAERLLGNFAGNAALLVMRDQSLASLREMVLRSGRRLVVPERGGKQVYLVPLEALGCGRLRGSTARQRGVLKLGDIPRGSKPYSGKVDAVVCACLAFDPSNSHLYSFDTDRVALTLEQLREGSSPGFTIENSTPILCLASDAQEVSGWPPSARSYVIAHAVITQSRFIRLPM